MKLPSDCIILPTHGGGLVVSPSLGTYCAIMPDEMESFREHLAHTNEAKKLDPVLRVRLDKHGFFGAPRPYRPQRHLLQFQVTNACNLRCAYCSACSGAARPEELTLEQVKQVIDEASALDPNIQFSFTGGEPFIVPWIFDAIDYAASHSHVPVGILSNLLLLKNNNELLDKVAQYIQNGLRVQMSISGSDREVCNRLSGRDCYDDAIAVIHKLHEKGALPNLDVMISAPDAQANIDAFADFRRALPSELKITLGILYPCGRENGEHTFDNVQCMEETMDAITFEGGVTVPAPELSSLTNRRKGCQCVENENIYIRSDGSIFSCFKLVECFGHISEGIKTVMERRRKTAVLASDLKMCRECPFVSLCASGCRADNFIFTNSAKAPICGKWRRQLIAEMLFEDKPFVLDWHIRLQMAEARKRGIETPLFVITSMTDHGLVVGG
ncbi:MAG: radical SAM protein [Proteobacteria bacterium]|nr:radical SAM protein [Pseudomonadota bacterium]